MRRKAINETGLFHTSLEIDRGELVAIEAAAFASIDCAIPIDMDFALRAMILDRLLADVEFDAGPSLAIAVMVEHRWGFVFWRL